MKNKNNTKNKYNRIANFYNFFTRNKGVDKISAGTQRVLDNIEGKHILEIGVGTGKVVVHYPDDLEVIGIDFSSKMLKKAQDAVKDKKNITLLEMDAQKLDFKDNTFDTVVSSFVFCSVFDPIKGIQEMQRVCKPNGKIIMVEHVRSNKKIKGKIMDWLNVLSVAALGEYINRDTENNVILAGFDKADVKSEYLFSDIIKFIEIRNRK